VFKYVVVSAMFAVQARNAAADSFCKFHVHVKKVRMKKPEKKYEKCAPKRFNLPLDATIYFRKRPFCL
jgi:hypothetical protein